MRAQALVAQLDVFAPGPQSAQAMAAAHHVPYLGRIPLDPCLGAAAEAGRSIFENATGTPLLASSCRPAADAADVAT